MMLYIIKEVKLILSTVFLFGKKEKIWEGEELRGQHDSGYGF